VPAAVRSKKPAVEDQGDISDPKVTGESDLPSFAVCKFKIGSGSVLGNFASIHEKLPPLQDITIQASFFMGYDYGE
jgi:hypothetical protein